MGSWRDTVTVHAQQDVDTLLNESLPFGQNMLEKHGEFFPYAVGLTTAGDIEMSEAEMGSDDRPLSEGLFDSLYDSLRSRRRSIRAAAVVSDVVMREPRETEAIRVEIEHSEGVALTVFLPYEKTRLPPRVRYGDVQAMPASRRIWS